MALPTYLPPASVQIKPDSSRSLNVLILNRMIQTIGISIPPDVFSAVEGSTLQSVLAMLRTSPQREQILCLLADLSLIPLQANRLKTYTAPFTRIIDSYAVSRSADGRINDIIKIEYLNY